MRFCGLISFLLLNLLAGQLIEAYPNSCQARHFFSPKECELFFEKTNKVMLYYQICQHVSLFFSHFRCFFSKFGGKLEDLEGRAQLSRAGILVRMMEQASRFFVPVKVWNFILFV